MSARPVLRLRLRASRALTGALTLVHGAAAACALAAAPSVAGLALAALLLCLGGVAAWDRALLRGRRSVHVLELSEDGSATLEFANGSRIAARVASRRHVSAWWVTLPLQGAPWRTVLVAADMLVPAEFRRLRLWALWGRVAGTPPHRVQGSGA